MPRGYRCVILAAFGWLALTGQHPNQAAKPEQAQTDHRIGDALANIAAALNEQAKRASPLPERQICGPRNYHGKDELCAQWKAADAAVDSAWWAEVSAGLGALSLVGVVVAVGLAFHSNSIARDTAKRQLRAYISVDRVTVESWDINGQKSFIVEFSNTGQTPAYEVEMSRNVVVVGHRAEYPPWDEFESFPISKGTIGAGKVLNSTAILSDLTHEDFSALNADEAHIVVFGLLNYVDAFGSKRHTRYRYGWFPATGTGFSQLGAGNDAN